MQQQAGGIRFVHPDIAEGDDIIDHRGVGLDPRVEAEGELDQIVEAVVVGVGDIGIGPHPRQVVIRIVGYQPADFDLGVVVQPIAVAVGVEGVGIVNQFFEVVQPVAIRVAAGGVHAHVQLGGIAQAVAVAVVHGVARIGAALPGAQHAIVVIIFLRRESQAAAAVPTQRGELIQRGGQDIEDLVFAQVDPVAVFDRVPFAGLVDPQPVHPAAFVGDDHAFVQIQFAAQAAVDPRVEGQRDALPVIDGRGGLDGLQVVGRKPGGKSLVADRRPLVLHILHIQSGVVVGSLTLQEIAKGGAPPIRNRAAHIQGGGDRRHEVEAVLHGKTALFIDQRHLVDADIQALGVIQVVDHEIDIVEHIRQGVGQPAHDGLLTKQPQEKVNDPDQQHNDGEDPAEDQLQGKEDQQQDGLRQGLREQDAKGGAAGLPADLRQLDDEQAPDDQHADDHRRRGDDARRAGEAA